MATAKAERLLNLVIALVNSPRYRTRGLDPGQGRRVRRRTHRRGVLPHVRAGQAGAARARHPGADAAGRHRTGTASRRSSSRCRSCRSPRRRPPRWRWPAGSGRPPRWRAPGPGRCARSATRRTPPARRTRHPPPTGATKAAPSSLLQPRVRTADPAFAPLLAAVRARRAVTFDYRKDPTDAPEPRALQPWGLVSYHGRWYVVGYDEARRSGGRSGCPGSPARCGPSGRRARCRRPDGVDLLAEVAASVQPVVDRTATLRVRAGHAGRAAPVGADVGARATDAPDWDRVTIPLGSLWDTARRIAGNGRRRRRRATRRTCATRSVRLLTGSAKAAATARDVHGRATRRRATNGLPLRETVGESG